MQALARTAQLSGQVSTAGLSVRELKVSDRTDSTAGGLTWVLWMCSDLLCEDVYAQYTGVSAHVRQLPTCANDGSPSRRDK